MIIRSPRPLLGEIVPVLQKDFCNTIRAKADIAGWRPRVKGIGSSKRRHPLSGFNDASPSLLPTLHAGLHEVFRRRRLMR
jgi:hypothetical protein